MKIFGAVLLLSLLLFLEMILFQFGHVHDDGGVGGIDNQSKVLVFYISSVYLPISRAQEFFWREGTKQVPRASESDS